MKLYTPTSSIQFYNSNYNNSFIYVIVVFSFFYGANKCESKSYYVNINTNLDGGIILTWWWDIHSVPYKHCYQTLTLLRGHPVCWKRNPIWLIDWDDANLINSVLDTPTVNVFHSVADLIFICRKKYIKLCYQMHLINKVMWIVCEK